MASHSSRKLTSRAEDKRLDHKRARQATRQVLEGGHHRVVHGMNWSNNIEQPPIDDEAPRRARSKKKGCKRNKGGPHIAVRRTPRPASGNPATTFWWMYSSDYVCDKCGKAMWGHKPSPLPHGGEHWTTEMILLRLAEGQDACKCSACKDKGAT